MSNLTTVAAAAFLLMLGCGGAPRRNDVPLDAGARRTLALDATNTLRETFNQDGCRAIYGLVSKDFRRYQSRDDWMNKCQRLREKVGEWENFEVQSVAACPPSDEFMCVSGSATFASGVHPFMIVYRMEANRARLNELFLRNGEEWSFPVSSGHRLRHYDPPRPKPGGPSPS